MDKTASDLRPSGPTSTDPRSYMDPVDIARVTHEANRALQLVQADPTIPVSPSWDDSSGQQQASVVSGVIGILDGKTPAESHEAWVEFKINDGWVLGAVKDEAAKTHPLLIPYEDLPPSQQVKDHLFAAIITALADA